MAATASSKVVVHGTIDEVRRQTEWEKFERNNGPLPAWMRAFRYGVCSCHQLPVPDCPDDDF